MRLADFILANGEAILTEWDAFARSLAPGAKMTQLALRNDAALILRATAYDMQISQTLAQQERKSKGQGGAGGDESDELDHASNLHGIARVGSAYDIKEVVSEYRALRASVLRLWRASNPAPDVNDVDDITRFNESIDQSLARAIQSYTHRVDQSRRMFLAILAHDLRNPLATIRMAAKVMSKKTQDTDCAGAATMIESQMQAVVRLLNDLIDFTSTGIGSAMPITRGQVELDRLCREVFDGFRSQHPGRRFEYRTEGGLVGQWDAARLRQVVTNLMGNAVQHGRSDGPITLSARADGDAVSIAVHNQGDPIPPEMIPTLFDPLVRHVALQSSAHRTPGSIGLGLYIVREIAVAHGGSVEVTSTPGDGTTFRVRIPRDAK